MANETVAKHMTTIKDNNEKFSVLTAYDYSTAKYFDESGIDVVLIGDVNSGAEIVATGNIFVMGKVKGMLHAGANGDKNCIITALNIFATQIRIADVISCIPEDKIIKQASRVYISDDKLYISPLLN